MALEVVNLGFGNVISLDRIVCIVKAGSNPMKRLIEAAEKEGRLVDATSGRRTRSVVITDSNHVVLSHINPDTLTQKVKGSDADEIKDAQE